MSERRTTLVQLLPALDTGGAERGALEVAAEAVRRDYRSIVVAAGGRLVGELEAAGSEHLAWPIGEKKLSTLRWVAPLRRLFAQADIVHARSRLPAWLGYFAWRSLPTASRPRWVTTVHGLNSVNPYSAVLTKAEAVIAVSRTVRDHLLCAYRHLDPRRLHLIYRGIDADEFPHGYRPAQPWLEDWYGRFPQSRERLLLTLPGRLSRRKGHADFVELLGRLAARGLPVCGLIVGATEGRRAYVAELTRRARRLGIEEHLLFVGQRSDMREIYAVSDLVLALSHRPEAFGRTVLESLSIGTPVVGYDHGGVGELLSELFERGRSPVGDLSALTRTTEQLLRRPPTLPAVTAFPRQRMLDQTLGLYRSLLHG